MNESIKVGSLYPNSLHSVPGRSPSRQNNNVNGAKFQQILDQKVLKFSLHAQTRLQQRGIELDVNHLKKLEGAIDQVAAKGAKDSLLVMNDLAFIVNVKSRTVVTALDSSAMNNNVFTQIDSAVVIQ